jgi:ACS family tartrate transporter-like MFS transporter
VWIARIMIVWGFVSAAMMFVTTPPSFYLLRFILGVAEAGFFPGILLYLTYWFPAAWRARAVARFMTATAVALVIGSPLSGAVLELDGRGGLAGRQWLFLLEGLPSVVLGLLVLRWLTDRPEQACWLSPAERTWLAERMHQDQAMHAGRRHHLLGQALLSPCVWLLALVYFLLVTGVYGVTFWLPRIVEGLYGLRPLEVGLVSAVPYLVAAVGMVWIGDHSDHRRERRWHVALSAFGGAVGLALSAVLDAPVPALAALSVGAVAIWGALAPFWAMPAAALRGTAAAGGIALINAVGNLGGFVGPYLIGYLRELSGDARLPLVALAVALVGCGVLVLAVRHDASLEQTR